MRENICHFVPYHKDYHSIHTINFVLETKPQVYNGLKTESVYKMYYVSSGSGYIHTLGKKHSLSQGDVFFTFPASHFCIESSEDFSFMYISFLGSRGNMIREKFGISGNNFVFKDCAEVGDFWQRGLGTNSELSDLVSESVLLYTFSYIGNKTMQFDSKAKPDSNAVMNIKKYIDDNFSDVDFSLKNISNELSYNPKYISAVFKKNIGIGIVEYLNTIRIQHACTLIKQGFTSVSDISACCGYSDPQYFSKVFKSKMKLSPMMYIKEIRNK